MKTSTHYKRNVIKPALQLFDVGAVIFIYLATADFCNTHHLPSLGDIFCQLHPVRTYVAFVIMGLLWNRFFVFAGLYNFRFYEKRISRLVKVVIYTSIAAFLFYSGMQFLGAGTNVPLMPYLFIALTTIFMFLTRSLLLFVIKFTRERQRNLKMVIIVGINKRSLKFAETISAPYIGAHVLGFLDTEIENNEYIDRIHPDKFIDNVENLNNYLARYPVDEVIILLPIKSFYDVITRVIAECAIQGIKARYINDMFDLYEQKVFIDMAYENDIAFLNFEKNNFSPFLLDCKRVIDIVVSLILIVLLSPLFVVIAVLIYLDDGWPVLFVQKRVGIRKKHFNLYKFRSMVKNAEMLQEKLEKNNEVDGAAFKITDDPRITRIGRVLRKTSLDELPQLFNVLLGNMSLVGPRPLPLRDYERFYKHSHRRRFSIKPGITGLWQVSGRNDISFEKWMALDLAYIDNWNLWLDFVILLKTIPAVISRKGAK